MERFVCEQCTRDYFLQDLIRKEGLKGCCTYCQSTGYVIEIGCLAKLVKIPFEIFYEQRGGFYRYWDDLNPKILDANSALGEATCINDSDLLEDLVIELQGPSNPFLIDGWSEPYSSESKYVKCSSIGSGSYEKLWNEFEEILKTKSRFFSSRCKEILDSIFEDIASIAPGDAVVRAMASNSKFFRARLFTDGSKLEETIISPAKYIGPPPAYVAKNGRMNARGISVFYGATDQLTAIAEVRPPVGSKVAVAKFRTIRDLTLLDLSVLANIQIPEDSIFNDDYVKYLRKINFLKQFSSHATKPVMPDDEDIDYLTTQAVSEYLADSKNIDGILFPSVQNKEGTNVVLFNHASRVGQDCIKGEPIVKTELGLDTPFYYVVFDLSRPNEVACEVIDRDRRCLTLEVIPNFEFHRIENFDLRNSKIIRICRSDEYLNSSDRFDLFG